MLRTQLRFASKDHVWLVAFNQGMEFSPLVYIFQTVTVHSHDTYALSSVSRAIVSAWLGRGMVKYIFNHE